MSDYELLQEVLRSKGDAARVIREMKLLLGVRTDSELASRLRKTQSAIAHWRRKGVVPEGALLDFERAWQFRQRLDEATRYGAARAIAMRVVSRFQVRGDGKMTAWEACITLAAAYSSIVEAVRDSIEAIGEPDHGAWPGAHLIDSQPYLDAVCDWVEAADWTDAYGAGATIKPAQIILPVG